MSSSLAPSERISQDDVIKTQIGKLLRRIHSSRAEILEYNQEHKNLSVWPWPIDATTGERTTPGVLYTLVKSGQSSPQCLCPLLNDDVSLIFQTSIARAAGGLHTGQLVIKCPADRCGYVAPLERIYKHGCCTRSFPTRENRTQSPPGAGRARPLKRSYANLGTPEVQPPHLLPRSAFSIAQKKPPIHRPTSDSDFLMRLNSWVQPGLYETEFRGLMERIAQCTCGMIMVREVFDEHRCKEGLLRPLKRARMDNEGM